MGKQVTSACGFLTERRRPIRSRRSHVTSKSVIGPATADEATVVLLL